MGGGGGARGNRGREDLGAGTWKGEAGGARDSTYHLPDFVCLLSCDDLRQFAASEQTCALRKTKYYLNIRMTHLSLNSKLFGVGGYRYYLCRSANTGPT